MNINFEELRKIFENNYLYNLNNMKSDFEGSYAQIKGVKLPRDGTQKSKTLVYLWLHKGKKVDKKTLDNLFSCGVDNQNARHLGRQNGFSILQWGDKFNEEKLNSGIYIFTSFNEIHYGWNLDRRRIDPNINWNQLKLLYKNKCAHCGSIEGESCESDKNMDVVIVKGHKNPDLTLNIENIIPLCLYCNRYYQNKVKFNTQGLITHFKYENEWISIHNHEKTIRRR